MHLHSFFPKILCSIGFLFWYCLLYAQPPSLDWVNGIISTQTQSGEAEGKSIAVDIHNNVYVLGYFSGTVDFNPDPKQQKLFTSAGEDDVFLVKYDSKGQYVWGMSMGGTESDQGAALAIDNSNNVYITGYFGGAAKFAESDSANLISAGGEDIFVVKYNFLGNFEWAFSIGGKGNERSNSIGVEGSSDVYIAGTYEETAFFSKKDASVKLVSKGLQDIFVAKYTSMGNYAWAKSIGSSSNDYCKALALDGKGDVYITGYFKESVGFDEAGKVKHISEGGEDAFLAKYDYLGNHIWSNRLGGSGNDCGMALTVSYRGNIFLAGYFSNTVNFNPRGDNKLVSAGGRDAFVAMYKTNGDYVWASKMGGDKDDYSTALEIDGSDNVFVTGCFSSKAIFGTSNLEAEGLNHDIFIAKYSLSGQHVWSNRIGGELNEYANALAIDTKEKLYMTGGFEGASDFNPNPKESAILNTNAIQTLFVAQYDGATSNYGFAFAIGYHFSASLSKIKAIANDAAGNLLVAGYFEGMVNFSANKEAKDAIRVTAGRWPDIFVAKYDSNGTFLWVKQFGGVGKEVCNGLVVDAQDNIYIAGYFENTVNFNPKGATVLRSEGLQDIFLAKYDPKGDLIWAQQMGGTGDDQCHNMLIDEDGNLVLMGSFENKANFNPKASLYLEAVKAQKNMFLAKYNSSGACLWANQLKGCSTNEKGNALALGQNNSLLLVGSFEGAAVFNSSATIRLNSEGSDDIFLAKYESSGACAWAKGMGGKSMDQGSGIATDKLGNIAITGYFRETASFSGDKKLNSKGSNDIFLAFFNSNADLLWARSIGGQGSDEGYAVVIDTGTNVYLAGHFYNNFQVGEANVFSLVSTGGTSGDILLSKYNSKGELAWARNMGGNSNDLGTGLMISRQSSAIYLTGTFQAKADFDPSSQTNYLQNLASTSAAFFAKYWDLTLSRVNYLSYEAKRTSSNEVSITWATGFEQENAGFEVERRLDGGKDFARVGFIDGFGTTNSPTNYRFSDANSFDGASYYRLKQLSETGRATYSNEIRVEGMPSTSDYGKVTLYPSPVQNMLNIRFGTLPKEAKGAVVRITNAQAKILHEVSVGVASFELLEIEMVRDLSPGRYLLNISYNNGKTTVHEFIKE